MKCVRSRSSVRINYLKRCVNVVLRDPKVTKMFTHSLLIDVTFTLIYIMELKQAKWNRNTHCVHFGGFQMAFNYTRTIETTQHKYFCGGTESHLQNR